MPNKILIKDIFIVRRDGLLYKTVGSALPADSIAIVNGQSFPKGWYMEYVVHCADTIPICQNVFCSCVQTKER